METVQQKVILKKDGISYIINEVWALIGRGRYIHVISEVENRYGL